MSDNEKLMRDALETIQRLHAQRQELEKRCDELGGDLAKARGKSARTVQDAIVDALRKTRRGGSAWHLLGGMAEAQKSRTRTLIPAPGVGSISRLRQVSADFVARDAV